MQQPREVLRATFEQVPELYERARPRYPPVIFDELVEMARLAHGARLVEIGCGTGQATVPLAQRGFAITCVELGQQLSTIARRNLAAFPNVAVVTTDFETWEPEQPGFDAVVAFSSFHWIAPEVRYRKAAELVHAQGKLVVVSTVHVLPVDGDPFFVDVQDDYDAVVPKGAGGKPAAGPPPLPDAIAAVSDEVLFAEIESSGRFRNAGAKRYLWDVTYSADDYVAVLNTYSGHRALDEETRARLDTRIQHRIMARPVPSVRMTYLALLYVAERI